MNIGTTPPPSYEEAIREAYTQSLQRSGGMVPYLLAGYPAGTSEPSAQPMAARSVSYTSSSTSNTSPIDKLMKLDKNTNLAKALNSLVRGFHTEIFDFENKNLSEDERTIINKADGLTRIPGCLNEKNYSDNRARIWGTFLNEVNLKCFGLQMKISDFNSWFPAVKRLCENTLQCCKTDATDNPDNRALVIFLDKLLSMASLENQYDTEEITRIKNDLTLGKRYGELDAQNVDYFISSLLTKTLDVKVFRDTLDALFTLYEFTPSPYGLEEISTKFNNIINANAKRSPCYTLYRR